MDNELEIWRREWQSEAEVPANLRRRVERQSRWLKIGLAADILVTVGIGGPVLALVFRFPQPEFLLLAAATWTFIAVAWAFRLAINRGLWAPSAVNTAAFVDLSIRRCRAQLKAGTFGAVLYVSEIVFCLGWVYRYGAPRQPLWNWLLESTACRIVALISIVFFIALARYRRKKRGDLEWLRSLKVAE